MTPKSGGSEILNSSWRTEIAAVFEKELRTELRTKSGLYSSGLFSIVAVVAIAFASYGEKLDGTLGAGLFWVTLLFSSVISLPRSFIGEEESGTADLLRLMARPHSVFWGKVIFNLCLILITAVLLSILFLALTNLQISSLLLYIVALVGGSCGLAVAVTLCGALVAQASNRAALAGAIGIPLLLPLVAMGVSSSRAALGYGLFQGGMFSALGLYSFAILVGAAGPYLYAAVWKE
jgi:heme exporter protein B